nr:cytochrome b/b6 domain-containing protein [Pseudomonas sp.]
MTPPSVIRVWDLPIRLFHWLLAACVLGSFVTVKVGGFWMDYHFLFGYAIVALLVFRLIWGLLGPRHARFTQFVRGPRAIYDYLRGRTEHSVGHSPLGALSVIAMLASITVQAATGLFANDGIMNEGPLAGEVSGAMSDRLTGIHQLNEPILLALIGLHIAAIVWYAVVRKRKLVGPMVTGDKKITDVPVGAEPTRDDAVVRLLAMVAAAVGAGIAWGLASMGGY